MDEPLSDLQASMNDLVRVIESEDSPLGEQCRTTSDQSAPERAVNFCTLLRIV